MKTQFMNFLPIVAGILLATSCGKDDDSTVTANNEPSNNEPTPVEIVAQPEYVKIPFSVKVDNGSKLSKMSYTGSDASITRSFEDSEADNLTMSVTGNGIKESTLTLKKDGDAFIFDGEITVESGKEDDFSNGIELTGKFGEKLTTPASSTVSLLNLMQNCNHEYMTTFNSNTTDPVVIYDQNAYFHFTLAPTQTKMKISTGEYSEFKINADGTKEIWIAVAGGTVVSGNLVSTSGMTTVASKIYNAKRTDVVDLGFSNNTLWKTSNESNNELVTYANISIPEGYRLPSKDELNEFIGMSYTIQDKVYSYTTEYGSISFPLLGYKTAEGVLNQFNQVGYYWSSDEAEGGQAFDLVLVTNFYYDHERQVIQSHDKALSFSVRAVRRL